MVDKGSTNVKDEANKIEGIGYSSLIFSLARCCFLGMAMYFVISTSKIDSYMVPVVSTAIGFIPLLLFIYIIRNKEGLDIIDLNIKVFGKIFGNILNFILNATIILLASIILYNLAVFLQTQILPNTAYIYVSILILTSVVYAASKNIAVISRMSQMIFFIALLMFFISLLGLFEWADLENLTPVLENGIKPIFQSSITYVIFSTAPIFLLTIISRDKLKTEKKQVKKTIIMYLLANFVLFGIIFAILTVLGYDVASIYKYPEYATLKKYSLFNIIERVENTLALQFIFDMVMYLIVAFYFAIHTCNKFIKKDKIRIFLPYVLSVIVLLIPVQLFKNKLESIRFSETYLPYIVSIGIFGPMIITAIGMFIKNIINKNKNKSVAQDQTETAEVTTN